MAPKTSATLDTVTRSAAFALQTDRVLLRITGADATRWLNGMVTNSAQALAPGEGNYNFLLNAQGRIQADCLLFREPDPIGAPSFLLITDGGQIERIQRHLDHYIIMDDVELTPANGEESTLLLLGPDAPTHLAALDLPALAPLRIAEVSTSFGAVLLLTPPSVSIPRFEIRGPQGVIASIREQLLAIGVPEADAFVLEQLRVLEATPRMDVDIRDRGLPQETGQNQALHFAKGCYLGQEIVERIRSRGQVHRTLTALRLEGALPVSLPTPLEADGKPVGELTSAAEIELQDGPALVALGYVRREALEAHLNLTYPGGTARPRKPGKAA